MPRAKKQPAPKQVQMTRKFIPTDKQAWLNEVRGIEKYLADMEAVKKTCGEAYVTAHSKYYNTRLQDLLNFKPKGVKYP